MRVLPWVLCFEIASASCPCTGIGPGAEGIARGLPVEYGSSCAAWDDGNCTAHACGSLQQCTELYPDATPGLWCCQPWCYVSASCSLVDTQPTTLGGSSQLYYSYQACAAQTSPVTEATCPWKQEVSFEEAAAAIVLTEKIGTLRSATGATDLQVFEADGAEVAIVALKDASLCIYSLRSYGGEQVVCETPAAPSVPIYTLAATSTWVATAREGQESIDFWQLSSTSLSFVGSKAVGRVRHLKISSFGLLSSTEDEMVTVWPKTGSVNETLASDFEGQLGPFSWAPEALEDVSFGQQAGIACASFADIEIWVPVKGQSNWTKTARLSGHSRIVTSLAFLPSMGLLASASLDSNLAIWRFLDGSWTLATLLYDHSHPVKAVVWIPSGPLLASGDEQDLILWRPATSPSCDFSYTFSYYLPGFNRFAVEGKTVDECQALCCENAWCTSFDYAIKGDDKTHGPNTCWLSSAGEGVNGGAGLVWDPSANYHYYEVTKRGSRFMTLAQPKGIASLHLSNLNGLLLSSSQEEGFVDVWKLTTSVCPDRQMAVGDGVGCKPCPLGRAGTGGLCPICRPGTFASEEGLSECVSCSPGTEMPGIGADTCNFCSPGHYASEFGTASCSACSPGYFNDRSGSRSASNCQACAKSTYAETSGSTACEACPSGTAHDNYAESFASTCVDCAFCGLSIVDGCRVPKDSACTDCPAGRVRSTTSSSAPCEYCPLGQVPNGIPIGDACLSFLRGDFNAVPDPNNRACWTRAEYGQLSCPQQANGGWGNQGPAEDTQSNKYLSLTATENEACSSLHCMGAILETQSIYNRMHGGGCLEDEGLKELCMWSRDQLNREISAREQASQNAEVAQETQLRQEKCQEVCDCNQLCADVTREEDAKEEAFAIEPFVVTQCEVVGLTCHAKCTSTRPAKVVDRPWQCMSDSAVSQIYVPKSTLPRCHASCTECPGDATEWHHGSFRECDSLGHAMSFRHVSMRALLTCVLVLPGMLAGS